VVSVAGAAVSSPWARACAVHSDGTTKAAARATEWSFDLSERDI